MYHDVLKTLNQELDTERFRQLCLGIYSLERSFCSRGFNQSAQLCHQAFKDSGLAQTELIAMRADGVNEALDFIMPQAWDVDAARLTVVSPEIPNPVIADLKLDPMSVANRCPPTPPEGITAEVVTLEAARAGAEVRGKIVFTQFEIVCCGHTLARDMIQRGALALISCGSAAQDEEASGVPWINGWGWPYWYQAKGDPMVPCFSISPSKARQLAALLRKNEQVTVKAVVNSRLYDGQIHTITGVLPGESSEEIVLLAHIYEPFIADDAAGAAAIIEIARMLKTLTSDGRLPKLKRSIRFLLSMEQFGMAQFFASPQQRARTMYAVNMDALGHDVKRLSAALMLYKSPHNLPFIGDFLLQELAETALAGYPLKPSYEWADNDNFISDSSIGIPSSWVIAPPGKLHHNSADRLDRYVDWNLAHKITTLVGGYALALATLDEQGAAALLRLASRRARSEVLQRAQELEDKVSTAKLDPATAGERLRIFGGWHQQRLRSLSKFTTRVSPEEHCRELESLAQTESARLGANESVQRTLTAEEQTAAGMVVRRLGIWCPASQARVPAAERFERGPAGWQVLNWCDGKRSLLEAVRLHAAEGDSTLTEKQLRELIEFLQKLEKYGYLEIKQH